jgi:hypothetical protein
MISRDEAEDWLKSEGNAPQQGSFLLRFGSSRIWPHPDAGALVVSYVGEDTHVHHKLLALDGITGSGEGEKLPLSEILLKQPELMHLLRKSIAPTKTQTSSGLHWAFREKAGLVSLPQLPKEDWSTQPFQVSISSEWLFSVVVHLCRLLLFSPLYHGLTLHIQNMFPCHFVHFLHTSAETPHQQICKVSGWAHLQDLFIVL